MDQAKAQQEFKTLSAGFWPYLRQRYTWKLSAGLSLIIILPIVGVIVTQQTAMLAEGYFLVWIYLLLAAATYFLLRAHEAYQTVFWSVYATARNWKYSSVGKWESENGLLFKQGEKRKLTHLLEGRHEGRLIRIFAYAFEEQILGKTRTHVFTVFCFSFFGQVPHLYLNRLHDWYGLAPGKRLNLPTEFNKQFSLYAPPEYEIEALAIFTPDLLASLLDQKLKFDMEIIEQKLYLYVPFAVTSGQTLLKRLSAAEEIMRYLTSRLDRARFEPIARRPSALPA